MFLFFFNCRLCREISFQFRTRLPHGLLVYHNVKNPDRINLNPYALYVIVEKGQLKVVHVFGKHSTSVTVGEGLNRDEWHNVTVSKTNKKSDFKKKQNKMKKKKRNGKLKFLCLAIISVIYYLLSFLQRKQNF